MRSKARLMGHPIHPMLIAFPLAFLCGALGFDAAGRLLDWPSGWTTGAYLNLAAIVSGLVAAVPGVIDYLYSVPPNSSGKKKATWHMIVNVSALTAFGVSWLFRDRASLEPGLLVLLLEAAGVGLVSVGGWLGGELVYHDQIGVERTYAGGTTLSETSVADRLDQPIDIEDAAALEVGQMKLVRVGERRVVLARTEQGFAAFDDRCSHQGGPLSDGVLICGTVQCPWHGSQFDIHTGAVRAQPAEAPIATHRVEVVDGKVRIHLVR